MQINSQKQNLSFSGLTIDENVSRKCGWQLLENINHILPELTKRAKHLEAKLYVNKEGDRLMFEVTKTKKIKKSFLNFLGLGKIKEKCTLGFDVYNLLNSEEILARFKDTIAFAKKNLHCKFIEKYRKLKVKLDKR